MAMARCCAGAAACLSLPRTAGGRDLLPRVARRVGPAPRPTSNCTRHPSNCTRPYSDSRRLVGWGPRARPTSNCTRHPSEANRKRPCSFAGPYSDSRRLVGWGPRALNINFGLRYARTASACSALVEPHRHNPRLPPHFSPSPPSVRLPRPFSSFPSSPSPPPLLFSSSSPPSCCVSWIARAGTATAPRRCSC